MQNWIGTTIKQKSKKPPRARRDVSYGPVFYDRRVRNPFARTNIYTHISLFYLCIHIERTSHRAHNWPRHYAKILLLCSRRESRGGLFLMNDFVCSTELRQIGWQIGRWFASPPGRKKISALSQSSPRPVGSVFPALTCALILGCVLYYTFDIIIRHSFACVWCTEGPLGPAPLCGSNFHSMQNRSV